MKKSIQTYFALILTAILFAGCSTSSGESSGASSSNVNSTASSAESSIESSDRSTGAADDDTVIIVGASSTPHAEILEQTRDALSEAGYTLEIVVFDDYVLPNQSLADGNLDANYFQHTPYLDSFNASNNTDLTAAALIHYEPFGLYGNDVADLSDLEDGITIIVPADDSNETRALLLLAQEGLITLPDEANATNGVTTLDIVDDGGYNIVTVQADTVAAQLNNSDPGSLAVINGNYALEAGLNVADALAVEDSAGDAAQTYANVIAVRSEDSDSSKTRALIAALETEEIRNYIEESYEGAVVAIF